MTDDHREVYEAILRAHSEGIAAALATVIETQGSIPRHAGSKMLVYANGDIVGTVGGGAMESRVIQVARQCLADGVARLESYTLNDLEAGDAGICGGTARIFVEVISIAPHLLVIGGGHVGKALAELGKWMGFRVTLSDDREAYANPEYVKGLDGYAVCPAADVVKAVSIDAHTYVAAVTRGLPVDLELLPALLQTGAPYIGLIGSRRRWALTVKELLARDPELKDALRRVRAPIGLEIGAESPREIALSILAEITMIRRGGTGLPMQWTEMLSD